MIALFASLSFTILSASILIIGSVVAASKGRTLLPGEQPVDRERMRDHLVWGLIYSNPDDPRGWIPKIRGPGWTVNVRDEGSAVLLAAVTIATIAGVLLTVVAALAAVGIFGGR
jgi:uncharacterized membrane protein